MKGDVEVRKHQYNAKSSKAPNYYVGALNKTLHAAEVTILHY
jgi:hypothetical protein